jgi:hypothetical protein
VRRSLCRSQKKHTAQRPVWSKLLTFGNGTGLMEEAAIEAALRWRPQFAPEPARCFQRFHRINKLDHALMNVTASGAF